MIACGGVSIIFVVDVAVSTIPWLELISTVVMTGLEITARSLLLLDTVTTLLDAWIIIVFCIFMLARIAQ